MKHKTKRRMDNKARSWAAVIATQVFDKYYYRQDLQDTCGRIVRYRSVIKKLIYFHAFSDPEYADHRTGDETYGYKSLEHIEGNLRYISDRFNCQFRLRWMLEVPERVEELKLNK